MLRLRTISRQFSKTSMDIILQLKRESESRFNAALENVRIVTCEKGRCVAEMTVKTSHTNPWNTLHGGCSASLIDATSHYALLSHLNNYMQPAVTLDMNLRFLDRAVVGDEIVIEAETVKAGKKIAYVKCNIKNKNTGKLLVEASQTEFYIESAKTLIEQFNVEKN